MRYKEFIEGIRMGAKDLAAPVSKEYTIGFEFEVAVKDNYINDDNYQPDEDDGDVDDDDVTDAYEEFSDHWYSGASTFDFEDWFKNFIRYDNGIRVVISNFDPRYGWVEDPIDLIDYYRQEEESRVKREIANAGGIEVVERAREFAKLFPDTDSLKNNIEQAKELIKFVYNKVKKYSTYQTEQEWTALFSDMPIDRVLSNANQALDSVNYLINSTIKKEINADDIEFYEEQFLYGNEEKDQIIDIDDIDDIEDVVNYFKTTDDDLRDELVDSWSESEQELMSQEFDDWYNNRRSSFSGGRGSKLKYVQQTLDDIRKKDWKVVPDGTPGVDAEIVTGVMSIEDGISSLKDVFNLINTNEFLFTESATGLHVNIGSWNRQEWNNVDWLKFLVIYRADRALAAFERQFNRYASDKLPQIIQDLALGKLDVFQSNLEMINSIVIQLSQKMSAVNLSKLATRGHIEIRAPGGTEYHNKGDELIKQIRRAIRALEIASDPNAYRKEYIGKLYKMLSGKQQEITVGITPTEKFFKALGAGYYANDPLGSILALIKNGGIDKNTIDKFYNTSVHKQLIVDLKRQESPNNIAVALRNTLKKYDPNDAEYKKLVQTRFIRLLLNAFPQLAQPAQAVPAGQQ